MYKRTLIILLTFALVPLIIFILAYFIYHTTYTNKEFVRVLSEHNSNSDYLMSEMIADKVNDIKSWSQMGIPEICFEYNRPEAMQVFLDSIKDSNKLYSHISAFLADGSFFTSDTSSHRFIEEYNLDKFDTFGEEKTIKVADGISFIVVTSKIFDHLDTSIGYISAYIKLDDLIEITAKSSNVLLTGNTVPIMELYYDDKLGPLNEMARNVKISESDLSSAMDNQNEIELVKNRESTIYCSLTDTIVDSKIYHCVGVRNEDVSAGLRFVRNIAITIAVAVLLIITCISFKITNTIISPFRKIISALESYKQSTGNMENIYNNPYKRNVNVLVEDIITLFDKLIENEKKISETMRLAAIGQSTAMVAHDVRKPFSQIKGVLDSFDEFQKEPGALEIARRNIDKSIRHVETMLADIMDFSRDVKLEVKPSSVIEIIDFSIREAAQGYPDRDVNFKYNIENEYKPLADGERLSRALANIIGNGIEAILYIGKKNHGCIDISVQDRNIEGNRYISIIIGNDGPSFNEEDIPNLFKPFFTKGKKKGTGLGLASAHKIISQHKGSIVSRNRTDLTGVEFEIVLPASNEKETGRSSVLPSNIKETQFVITSRNENEINEIASKLSLERSSYKVVLLEDEALYRASVRNTIKKNDRLNSILTLYEASTVEDALKLVQREGITHAIVDIDLGEIKNGFDFLQIAKKEHPTLKCMVHSNRCIEEDKQKAYNLGALSFVPKPLSLEHLVMFLSSHAMSICHSREDGNLESPKTLDPCLRRDDKGSRDREQMDCHVANAPRNDEKQKKKILLVNDDEGILISYKMLLKKIADITTAKSVKEGNESFIKSEFDVIISDINLGDSEPSGYDFLKDVRQANKQIPFYMMSGYSAEDEEPKAIKLGANGYIKLPADKEVIVSLLENI